jgi:serine/threonine-protein kinase RsbW
MDDLFDSSSTDRPDPVLRRRLAVPSQESEIETAVDWLEGIAEELDLEEETTHRLIVAASEAVTNSLHHGNEYDPVKDVIVEVNATSEAVEVTVSDEGGGFQRTDVEDPLLEQNLENVGGRGVYLMEELTDRIEYQEDGCKVRLRFDRPSA